VQAGPRCGLWPSDPVPLPSDIQIETERALIRPCSDFASGWYLDVLRRNREHIAKYMPDHILSMDSTGEVLAWQKGMVDEWRAGRALCLVAIGKDAGEFLAQTYVGPVDLAARVVEIGYFGDLSLTGRGFVTEVVRAVCSFLFRTVKVHKVVLQCDQGNVRSCRVAELSGFTQEGVLRAHGINKDGSRPNRTIFGRLATDAEPATVKSC
jgi:RimJ/RimL family protein N-acetyltransferase